MDAKQKHEGGDSEDKRAGFISFARQRGKPESQELSPLPWGPKKSSYKQSSHGGGHMYTRG